MPIFDKSDVLIVGYDDDSTVYCYECATNEVWSNLSEYELIPLSEADEKLLYICNTCGREATKIFSDSDECSYESKSDGCAPVEMSPLEALTARYANDSASMPGKIPARTAMPSFISPLDESSRPGRRMPSFISPTDAMDE